MAGAFHVNLVQNWCQFELCTGDRSVNNFVRVAMTALLKLRAIEFSAYFSGGFSQRDFPNQRQFCLEFCEMLSK